MRSVHEAKNLVTHFLKFCNNSTINSKSENAQTFISALNCSKYRIQQAYSKNTRLILFINDVVMTVSWNTVFIDKYEFAINFTIFKIDEHDQFDLPQNILFEFYILPQVNSHVDIYVDSDDEVRLIDSVDYGTEITELSSSIIYLFTRL